MLKFYPSKIIRYYCKYTLLLILVVIPLGMAILPFVRNWGEDGYLFTLLWGSWAIPGCVIVHIGFWEKCSAVLSLTDTEVRWTCPFRKARIMRLSDCVEIGVYIENENNGIPKEQIYFSDHKYPQQNMRKDGSMKPSRHLIVFWYSDELGDYIMRNYPSKQTSRLNAYRRQRNK